MNAKGKACWVKKVNGCIRFTCNLLKTTVKHLIENCFFTVANITLKQDKGISMGIDPALFWANLFLYFYQNQFMTELISNNEIKYQHFHSIKVFTDDLNDGGKYQC